jgi:hypothetical protein
VELLKKVAPLYNKLYGAAKAALVPLPGVHADGLRCVCEHCPDALQRPHHSQGWVPRLHVRPRPASLAAHPAPANQGGNTIMCMRPPCCW